MGKNSVNKTHLTRKLPAAKIRAKRRFLSSEWFLPCYAFQYFSSNASQVLIRGIQGDLNRFKSS